MTGRGRFAKSRLSRAPAPASRCAASTCMRSIISFSNRSAPPLNASTSAPARSTSASARREGAVAGLDLVGVDQALAVEAEPPSLLRLGSEAVGIVEAVEHAVEHGDAGGARGQHDHLQRQLKSARASHRAAGAGRRAGRWCRRSAPAHSCAISGAASTPAAVSIIASTGLPTASRDVADQMRRDRPAARRRNRPSIARRRRGRANAIRCRRR